MNEFNTSLNISTLKHLEGVKNIIDLLPLRTHINKHKIVLQAHNNKQKHIKGCLSLNDKSYWLSGLNKAQLGAKEQIINYVIVNNIVYKLNTYTRILKGEHIQYRVLDNTLVINTPCNNTPYTLVEIYKTTKSQVQKLLDKE